MDPILVAGTGLVILGLVVWIVCVVAAYQQAPRRGRSPINWAILTVIFGPLALFALFAMASKRGAPRAEGPRAPSGRRPGRQPAGYAIAR
jgi:hypothetical protein